MPSGSPGHGCLAQQPRQECSAWSVTLTLQPQAWQAEAQAGRSSWLLPSPMAPPSGSSQRGFLCKTWCLPARSRDWEARLGGTKGRGDATRQLQAASVAPLFRAFMNAGARTTRLPPTAADSALPFHSPVMSAVSVPDVCGHGSPFVCLSTPSSPLRCYEQRVSPGTEFHTACCRD